MLSGVLGLLVGHAGLPLARAIISGGAMLSLLLCAVTLTPVYGNELNELLLQAKQESQRAIADEQARMQRFLADHEQQQTLVDQARAELAALEAEGEDLQTAIKDNEQLAAGLQSELYEQAGDLRNSAGIVRQAAGALLTRLDDSLVSPQFPARAQPLRELANGDALPTLAQIEQLWLTLLQELVESGNIARFQAPVVGSDGRTREQRVLRVGVFDAISEDGFLRLEQGLLHLLPRQPGSDLLATALDYLAAGTSKANAAGGGPASQGALRPMVVDPTRGEWLDTLVLTPTLRERLQQGGTIGYLIMGLGTLGLVVGLWRLLALSLVSRRMERQLGNLDAPGSGNPLGRVLAAYPEAAYSGATSGANGAEDIEVQLHEAVLREIPYLSRGQTLLKLLAAVTPLLGLLGTVTGMIVTFQAISLFGTSDPRLMADGISQALMTTILGLSVAIPLLFLHSGVVARGRALIQILDEESAGLVVRRHIEQGLGQGVHNTSRVSQSDD